MKIWKNLFGRGDKIHADEIAVAPGLLLGGAVIVESGSNNDGEYVRWGNGLQICWVIKEPWPGAAAGSSHGEIFRSSEALYWYYPESFYGIQPIVSGSASGSGWIVDSGGASRDNMESFAFRVLRALSSTTDPVVRLFAIGRWK